MIVCDDAEELVLVTAALDQVLLDLSFVLYLWSVKSNLICRLLVYLLTNSYH
jgi:hypothetical protein